jgi:general stress protein 26
MLTTVDADGTLNSRLMGTQDKEFDGTLYFITGKNSHKSEELRQDSHVNIAYANPDSNRWVSVTGTATASRDQQKIDELWSPFHKAWFPEGKHDPSIMVIRVDVDSVEYWEAASRKMVQVAGLVKSLVTGKLCRLGENKTIDMNTGAVEDLNSKNDPSWNKTRKSKKLPETIAVRCPVVAASHKSVRRRGVVYAFHHFGVNITRVISSAEAVSGFSAFQRIAAVIRVRPLG